MWADAGSLPCANSFFSDLLVGISVYEMKKDKDLESIAKQIQDDIKGLTDLSGRMIELDKEEKRVDRSVKWIVIATVTGIVIAAIVVAWVILT